MNTKSKEAQFIASVLERAGVAPLIVDLSMKPHDLPAADITGDQVAGLAGTSWQALNGYARQEAAAVMVKGGIKLLHEKHTNGDIAGVIGIGGANGTNLVCSILRSLPYLIPKVMVSTVAGTAAVQWYVAESDIAMYPSIGDISLNRITTAIMENAANAVAIAASNYVVKRKAKSTKTPLVAVSSFGGTAGCVERVSQRLEALGYEIILFHASGVGGKSLERLSLSGELAGVVDVTTHELADLVVEGVYSAGETRMTGAGTVGLPQVIAPGAIDHANFWVGQVPDRYKTREFAPHQPRWVRPGLCFRWTTPTRRWPPRPLGLTRPSFRTPIEPASGARTLPSCSSSTLVETCGRNCKADITSSVCLSACGDRPERLDHAVANADIPIVHVARRVAVPRHEPQLLIDL